MKTLPIFWTWMLFCSTFTCLLAQKSVMPLKKNTETSLRTKIIKIGILSPLGDHLEIGYEQWIRNRWSIEGSLAVIGVGFDVNRRETAGAFIKIGPKLKLGRDFYVPGMVKEHPLQGTYFKPEFIFSIYREKDIVYFDPYYQNPTLIKRTFKALAFNFVFGKQWIINGRFAINLAGGVGYGDITRQGAYQDRLYQYSHLGGDGEFPLTFSGNFTFGFLLK